MTKEFKIPDITELFGLKRNLLQQYLDRGFIDASIQRSTKRGEPNIFSVADLCLIRFFQKLIEVGFSWEMAHKVSKNATRYFRRSRNEEAGRYLAVRHCKTKLGLSEYASELLGSPKNALHMTPLEENPGDFAVSMFFDLGNIEKEVESML